MEIIKKVLKGIGNFWHKGALSKVLMVVVVLFVVFNVKSCIGGMSDSFEKRAEHNKEFSWPSNTLTDLLVEPTSHKGEIIVDREDLFEVNVFDSSEKDFNTYVNDSKDKGFTLDYDQSSFGGTVKYSANHEKGYSLYVSFYQEDGYYDKDTLNIMIRKIEEESNKEEDVEEESKQEESETNESESSEMVDGMRKEFKESMDSYEEFFDQYCKFMKKYNSSSDTLSMLADYTEMMSQYADTMVKFEDLKNDDLNKKELAYYTKVSTRITQKLVEVGSSL